MAKTPSDPSISQIPNDYVAIPGSERRPSSTAKLVGPTDPNEILDVTIVLRRRPDGPNLPDHDYFLSAPPAQRQRMSAEEFAAKFGASQDDIDRVVAFAQSHGLAVVETSAARRTVVVRGTVAQMSAAFGVRLDQYEHEVLQGRDRRPQTETYRGRDGVVSVPSSLDGIVVGAFGLDNRRVGQTNGAEPPNTHPLWIPPVSTLYNYPTNSAAGQTIGIFSLSGYASSDIAGYYTNLNAQFPSAGYVTPSISDVLINGATNPGYDPYGETTQDIDIASSFAPGCAISVYITTGDQAGWVQAISRVAHPNPGDAAPSVLSSSWYIADGDDPAGLAADGVTLAFVNAVSAAFQDAAIQGVTVCIASGDRGTDSGVGDGECHVQYPASDPWVLSVGGTTIGNVSGSSFDEYVWNDPNADPYHGNWGTTGGGVSALFALPAYQSGAGVPVSLNPPHNPGRGVPDVAGNANLVSGYWGIVLGGQTAAWPQSGSAPFPGNGTSASAPQWAGLIAVINAALGFNVGFVNPVFYALGSSYFRDIVPGAGPANNANSGSPGYPAGPGWDACTGWGSPNGIKLLNGLAQHLGAQDMQFWVEDSTFGADQVQDSPSYANAFWLVLEGFTPNVLGISAANPSGTVSPSLSGAFLTLLGASNITQAGPPALELPGSYDNVQRIRYPFNINFPTGVPFPGMGSPPAFYQLGASISVPGNATPFTAQTVFELVAGANPYFANIDPSANNAFWLSQDLRVFTITPTADNQTPIGSVPFTFTTGSPTQRDSAAAYNYIQGLVGYFNGTFSDGSTDPFSTSSTVLPDDSSAYSGDSSVTPARPNPGHPTEPLMNYNFALARVRLRGPSGSANEADNVKVFFRIFGTQTNDTDYVNTASAVSLNDPFITYPSTPAADPNAPAAPQPGTDASGTINGCTLPFFADANQLDLQPATMANPNPPYGVNNRNIIIPMGSDSIWSYFGCYLNLYDDTVTYGGQTAQQWLAGGTHHCIAAQIAYDGAPIENEYGVIESPENCDKLAQRNLQITPSSNPGFPLAHRIPQTFDLRPSPSVTPESAGYLTNLPDELMIDWGNVPTGSTASIYWPQLDADGLIQLAAQYHSAQTITKADSHTIQFKVQGGVTYLPIPTGTGENFAGLFTLDLPSSVRIGEQFQVVVRRITSRQLATQQPAIGVTARQDAKGDYNWRYVVGSFAMTVPVEKDEEILPQDENLLAILKWRLTILTKSSRWYPILQRYVMYVEGRIRGMGQDPGRIQPSQFGTANQPIGQKYLPIHTSHPHEKDRSFIGKVATIAYDRFGDFEGFLLRTECGEERFFRGHEPHVEDLILNAWNRRILISVAVDGCDDWPAKIVLLRL